MTTDIARTAARIIAGTRGAYNNPDAFDLKLASEGIAPFGELYQEAYRIANEGHIPDHSAADPVAQHKARAAELWEQVLPEMERYAAECKAAKYTGWSKESTGPVRRVR